MQKQLFVNRNNAQSNNNSKSENDILVSNKNKYFQQMAVAAQIISQHWSVIKQAQVDNMININGRGKQFTDGQSGELSALSKKKWYCYFWQ